MILRKGTWSLLETFRTIKFVQNTQNLKGTVEPYKVSTQEKRINFSEKSKRAHLQKRGTLFLNTYAWYVPLIL